LAREAAWSKPPPVAHRESRKQPDRTCPSGWTRTPEFHSLTIERACLQALDPDQVSYPWRGTARLLPAIALACLTRQQKLPICRDFYGSDGTRTRDLRRDRPAFSSGSAGTRPRGPATARGSQMRHFRSPQGRRRACGCSSFGGRGLDRVVVEFADCEARGLVNERPSRSCASG
jgi:hypothetical protein